MPRACRIQCFTWAALILVLSLGVASTAVAQSETVAAAYGHYGEGEVEKAAELIDAAALHETTSQWATTWYYRALIYRDLYSVYQFEEMIAEPYDSWSAMGFVDAQHVSLRKVASLTEKRDGVDDDELAGLYTLLASTALAAGSVARDANDLNAAAALFAKSHAIYKEAHNGNVDPVTAASAAMAYEQLGDAEQALAYYQEWTENDAAASSPSVDVSVAYTAMANILIGQGHPDRALAVLSEAVAKYPAKQDLVVAQFTLRFQSGLYREAIQSLDLAIQNEPNNARFYYNRGLITSSMGSDDDSVEQDYKKALALDEALFGARFNLGALYFDKATELLRAANDLPFGDAYTAAQQRAEAQFMEAVPHLERAHELEPSDQDTIVLLLQLYAQTDQMEKHAALKLKLE